jgi:hypothetical protein
MSVRVHDDPVTRREPDLLRALVGDLNRVVKEPSVPLGLRVLSGIPGYDSNANSISYGFRFEHARLLNAISEPIILAQNGGA